MKKSPFILLKEYIENTLFDVSLLRQLADIKNPGKLQGNPDYNLGYVSALRDMLAMAESIYKSRG